MMMIMMMMIAMMMNSMIVITFCRFLESHWFTLVTQMNHIPMQVDKDHNDSWLKAQVQATCNVEPSYFNNWFTGHLNFQIEHQYVF